MKRPRLITRRRAKWAGLLASLLIATCLVASCWFHWSRNWQAPSLSRYFAVRVSSGGVRMVQLHPELATEKTDDVSKISSSLFVLLQWSVAETPVWIPKYEISHRNGSTRKSVEIPLWLPLFLTALPTAILFRNDRKPKPGHCTKCRYNLAGLKDNKCPECGTEIPPASESTPPRDDAVD